MPCRGRLAFRNRRCQSRENARRSHSRPPLCRSRRVRKRSGLFAEQSFRNPGARSGPPCWRTVAFAVSFWVDRVTKEKLLGPPFVAPLPHVVILGAGASRAAFPHGDRYGNRLPLIDDLPAIVGKPWHDVVKFVPPPIAGFESQFSWLRQQLKFDEALYKVERRLIEYF